MAMAGNKMSLLHTVKGRQRIIVAISWDERAKKTTVFDHIRGTNQQHDLDLSCFVYDSHGEYIDYVGSMAQDSMDQTGAIYHSGDDATGSGGGDDEAISIELSGLPDDTTDLIFVTEIRSKHTFKDVHEPQVRVADSMTNKDLFNLALTQSPQNAERTAWVMARIYREPGSPTGWALQSIDEYPSLDEVSDWGSYLTRYLD